MVVPAGGDVPVGESVDGSSVVDSSVMGPSVVAVTISASTRMYERYNIYTQ